MIEFHLLYISPFFNPKKHYHNVQTFYFLLLGIIYFTFIVVLYEYEKLYLTALSRLSLDIRKYLPLFPVLRRYHEICFWDYLKQSNNTV